MELICAVDEQFSFWKNYGKCDKTQRYKTSHSRMKKKLFGVRTKLSYYKFFTEDLLAIKMKKRR